MKDKYFLKKFKFIIISLLKEILDLKNTMAQIIDGKLLSKYYFLNILIRKKFKFNEKKIIENFYKIVKPESN